MKAVFFDLYGTLADIWTDEGKPELWQGTADFLSLRGAPYEPDELRTRYLALCDAATAELAAKRPDLGRDGVEIELRDVFRRLWTEKGAEASEERTAGLAALFRALSYTEGPKCIPGAAETLATLRGRGVRVFLLSNAQSCFTRGELAMLSLADAFDGIFLSSDWGCKKPHEAFFRLALERTGLRPDEVLMVGNDPVADMAGAGALGIPGRYLHTRQSPPKGKDFTLPPGCREIAALGELLREGDEA